MTGDLKFKIRDMPNINEIHCRFKTYPLLFLLLSAQAIAFIELRIRV